MRARTGSASRRRRRRALGTLPRQPVRPAAMLLLLLSLLVLLVVVLLLSSAAVVTAAARPTEIDGTTNAVDDAHHLPPLQLQPPPLSPRLSAADRRSARTWPPSRAPPGLHRCAAARAHAAPGGLPPETEQEERTRFQLELEFVQCLASPAYLHCTRRAGWAVGATPRRRPGARPADPAARPADSPGDGAVLAG